VLYFLSLNRRPPLPHFSGPSWSHVVVYLPSMSAHDPPWFALARVFLLKHGQSRTNVAHVSHIQLQVTHVSATRLIMTLLTSPLFLPALGYVLYHHFRLFLFNLHDRWTRQGADRLIFSLDILLHKAPAGVRPVGKRQRTSVPRWASSASIDLNLCICSAGTSVRYAK
jgi:hypothetical protein